MSAVDFERFVHDLATRSGEAILPFFRTALTARNKAGPGAFDPVTEGDKAGEVVLRRMIRETFPAHGVIGEEFGTENADAEYVWVLDPIDGTRAFMSGLPVWGTLIGLKRGGAPVFGMMHQPFTGERFFGDGEGARYRGPDGERELMTRACATLADATLMTTSPRLFRGKEKAAFERVEKEVRLTRFGCDCYAYCMVAAGHVDLVIETGLQPYDIVALAPIIEGAGGVVTTWEGGSPAEGGASSPPATGASTRRRWRYCAARRARLQLARHEGVDGRPDPRAHRVRLVEEFVPRARNDDRHAVFTLAAKRSMTGVDTTSSRPEARIIVGTPRSSAAEGSDMRAVKRIASVSQRTVGSPMARCGCAAASAPLRS